MLAVPIEPYFIALTIMALSGFFGLSAVYLRSKLRVILTFLAIVCTMLANGWLIVWHFDFLGVAAFVFGLYQVLNLIKLIYGRFDPKYLKSVFLKSFWALLLLQILLIVISWSFSELFSSDYKILISISLGISLVWGIISTYLIALWFKRTNPGLYTDTGPFELPTISLLIPARNEDQDLTQCIESALKSDYPKLEVLVLDDCSSDKTPELIRHYAQQGVRFISGISPTGNWLAKNQAYDRLASEASGEILIFTGVDTRMTPGSIAHAVKFMRSKNARMISIMPLRGGQKIIGTLIQPMRYWLEFVGSKIFAHRPPVLSTCWIIYADEFHKLGGLKAVKNSINPEAYFASRLAVKTSYRFVRANKSFGIITLKTIRSQIDTAVRTRYPSLKKRIDFVAVASLAYLIFMVAPFIYVLTGWGLGYDIVYVSSFVVTLLLGIPHIVLTISSNPGAWWLSLVSFPFVVSAEVVLMNASMFKYEFGHVDWKGRNICLPVMYVTPSLPKLEDD